ncbi:MAG: hypothetical protein ACYTFI_05250 [Planctomycetota bacterium]|jgi:hypothetical protein
MPAAEQKDALPPPEPLPPELVASKHAWKVAHLFAGVALPVACFTLNFWVMAKPAYQSGSPHDFAMLFLRGEVAFVFYPLLALSMAAMCVAAFRLEAAARSLPVRLGVYLGVPLALQYSVAMSISLLLAAVLLADQAHRLSVGSRGCSRDVSARDRRRCMYAPTGGVLARAHDRPVGLRATVGARLVLADVPASGEGCSESRAR